MGLKDTLYKAGQNIGLFPEGENEPRTPDETVATERGNSEMIENLDKNNNRNIVNNNRNTNNNNVVDFPNGNMTAMQVVISEPSGFRDVKTLSNQLKSHKQVIINLENTPREISQRIIDFLNGTAYAISGQSQQIGKYIFVFTPQNMEISKDERTDSRRGTGAGYFMNAAAPMDNEEEK